ncbi:hypothetical protein DCC62_29045 [candidate division KSB1 bacterium]|nr:hypothetical protein [candidate division KSB1 bacterium]RIK59055.1 MAG: hypothetical protein DCC62_29045 [candidate division KSB1 bacterium]
MSTMVTVHFPKTVYQRLQQQAKVLKRPVDDIVVQTVQRGLPLWLDIIPPDFERDLAQLDKLSAAQLRKIAGHKLAGIKQRKLDELLQKNSDGTLTSKEAVRLDAIHLEANLLMLKKAKALALLKDKGHKPPPSKRRG